MQKMRNSTAPILHILLIIINTFMLFVVTCASANARESDPNLDERLEFCEVSSELVFKMSVATEKGEHEKVEKSLTKNFSKAMAKNFRELIPQAIAIPVKDRLDVLKTACFRGIVLGKRGSDYK